MFRKTSFLVAMAMMAAMPATSMAAGSLGAQGGSTEKKICKNTYHPGGLRCTFCYYTTQPGSGNTVCIKLNTGGSKSGGPAKSFAN